MTYVPILTSLSDPTRRAIFEALRDGPMSVSQLAQGQTVSRPAVSQHLKHLQNAGLVQVVAQGTRRIYSIDPKGLFSLREYLDSFWGDALDAFAHYANSSRKDE
jgi:DNA-binding transcriptional ArsR family regulator